MQGLESVEAQLIVQQKNEVVYEKKIAVLEFEVKDKSNAITRLKNQLDETLREKDDLKAKLEQFETSSKNLTKLINSQISSKDKTGLGYGDQLNENDSSGSELFNSVFDSRSSDGDDNQTNDRFKKDNGYHVVPPPLSGNYMPPLADLSFAGLDDSAYRPTTNKTSASMSQVETSTSQTSIPSVEMPRVESVRPSGVIIEDWVSDDDEDILQSNDLQATEKPSFKRIKFTNARNEFNSLEQHLENKSSNIFVPSAVLTRSGRVPVSAAKQSSFRAAVSTALNTRISNEKVNTVRVNSVNTARQTTVSVVKGNGVTAVKASAGCVWRPKMTDLNNLLDASQVLLRVPRQSNMYSFDLKNVVPSGDLTCLFAKATIDESKLWHRRLGYVNFKTMNKLVKGNLVRGIKREFSVARILQQNGVAERKNMTLIEVARTMLTDSLLPTVFWAEAVNTACYVLNRVLVTKPHNKTPYELIIGRPPSISFMRPFGCSVTILNTLDPLGKFDGKAEEGKVEENLHVNFLENKPNVAGQGPNWLFDIDSLTNSMNYQPVTAGNQSNKNAGPQETNGNTGLKKNVDAGQSEEKNVSTQQYIVFPLWSSISSINKSSEETDEDDTADDAAGEKPVQKPASENQQTLKNILDKMMDQEKEAKEQSDTVRKEFEAQCNLQNLSGKTTIASSTNSFNTVSTPVNTAGAPRTSNDVGPSFVPLGGFFLDDPLMPDLEDTVEVQNTGIFGSAYDYDDLDTYNSPYANQVMGAKANFNNMEPSTVVSPILSTIVHSIHPKDQIIRDPRSAVQTRGMTKKSFKEHAMISYIQK
ncbi:putative ribonuclease H-like domain-containing protein [Tanacetum coccineum]|uniref:Ribonuclease H-like domain-containing protein n=1 Tax=Tanacetum coccineum TaxID=301880 RepID=A0ABQ4WMR8_9ASTR